MQSSPFYGVLPKNFMGFPLRRGKLGEKIKIAKNRPRGRLS
jgi:hypothetical protein